MEKEKTKRKIKLSIIQIVAISIVSFILLFLLIFLIVDLSKYRLNRSNGVNNYNFEQGTEIKEGHQLFTKDKYEEKEVYKKDDNTKLLFDYRTTNVVVMKNGKRYETIPYKYFSDYDSNPANIQKKNLKYFITDKNKDKEINDILRSPLNLSYIYRGIDIPIDINGFTSSIKSGNYKVYKLKNGIRVEYDIAERKIDKTWIPNQFSKKEFDKIIKENKSLEQFFKKAYDYKESLSTVKRKQNIDQAVLELVYNIFLNKYKIDFNDLIKRNQKYNPEHTYIKRPHFIIPVEYRLTEDGNLDVRVLTDRIKELSPNLNDKTLKLCEIKLLPNFVKTNKAGDSANETDYLFVPDGQGAIIKPKGLIDPKIDRFNFYKNDSLLVSNYNKINLTPYNTMPFYGVSDSDKAILADVKNGVANADLTTRNDQYYYRQEINFRLKQFANHEFVKGQKIKFYENITLDEHIQIKYFLIAKEKSTYYDFVKTLQDEYFKTSKIKPEATLLFEVLGAFMKKEHILGIPNYKLKSLTNYEQFYEIKKMYEKYNILYKYSGFSKGGISGATHENITYERKLGKWSLYNQILKDNDTFLDTYLIEHYNSKEGHYKERRHAIRTIGGNLLKLGYENRRDILMDGLSEKENYSLLSPNYLYDYILKYLKNNKDVKNLAIRDLGNQFLRNYTTDLFSGDRALKEQEKSLSKMLEENKKLMLKNPFFNLARFASHLEDMPLETSNKIYYYSQIPFLQLLLSPYSRIFSASINLSESNNSNYQLLKALLSNTNLKYSISYNDSEITKGTKFYNRIFATNIFNKSLKDDISNIYNKTKEFYTITEKSHIKNHEILSSNVFKITYENDKTAIFNLSDKDYLFMGENVLKGTYKFI